MWREVDPRSKRFVVVLAVNERQAVIRNVSMKSGNGRFAQLDRFNGRRGGYRYIADGIVCSRCGSEFSAKACGPTHAAIAAAMQ
jgi:hypothetical protein